MTKIGKIIDHRFLDRDQLFYLFQANLHRHHRVRSTIFDSSLQFSSTLPPLFSFCPPFDWAEHWSSWNFCTFWFFSWDTDTRQGYTFQPPQGPCPHRFPVSRKDHPDCPRDNIWRSCRKSWSPSSWRKFWVAGSSHTHRDRSFRR